MTGSTRNTATTLGLALVLAAVAVTTTAAPAEAGCLQEWQDCGDCAGDRLEDALESFDVIEAIEAFIDGIDCDIDLYHCVVLGGHHAYDCA